MLKPAVPGAAAQAAVKTLAADTADGGPAMLVGAPWRERRARCTTPPCCSTAAAIAAVRLKHDLPNYGVFDEKRVFAPGPLPGPIVFRGVRLGVLICEDMWTPDVAECLRETGAEILVVPNGSPFETRQGRRAPASGARRASPRPACRWSTSTRSAARTSWCSTAAPSWSTPGDGGRARAPTWTAALTLDRLAARGTGRWRCVPAAIAAEIEDCEAIYHAMMLGLRDYVNKNRFPGVVLGLSGGIDSALTAAVAVDALGAGAGACGDDALALHQRATAWTTPPNAPALLGIRLDTIADRAGDGGASATCWRRCSPAPSADITEENIQARARGLIADGDLQQVRPHGADHRQQVGDVGRLRHALWRHVRRLFGAEGRLQDDGLRARRAGATQSRPDGCAGAGRAASSPSASSPSRRPPSCAPNQTDQDSLPPYDHARRHPAGLVEDEAGGRGDRRRGPRPRPRCSASGACSTAPNTSAARRRPASRSPAAPSAATGAIRSPTASPRLSNAIRSASASRPARPGCCMSAMSAPRWSTGCSRARQGGAFLLRLDDTDRGALDAEASPRHRAGPALARPRLGRARAASRTGFERYEAVASELRAAGRLYPCYETPEELELQAQAPPVAGHAADL